VNYQLARATRRYKDLTQAEVAAQVGVAAETLSRWESGDREPKASHLQRWAAALGLTMDELASDETPATLRKAEVP
jgi:transcriptional regulator with XRE-family HTH domain